MRLGIPHLGGEGSERGLEEVEIRRAGCAGIPVGIPCWQSPPSNSHSPAVFPSQQIKIPNNPGRHQGSQVTPTFQVQGETGQAPSQTRQRTLGLSSKAPRERPCGWLVSR